MAPKTETTKNEAPVAVPPIPAIAPVAPTAAKATDAKSNSRVEPELTPINSSLTMPTPPRGGRRGSVSLFPFDALQVGQSFGVKNKTLSQMQGVISNQNKKGRTPKLDENGNKVMKMITAQDGAGNEVQVPGSEVETVEGKRFFGIECDPANDPDGAAVRVWRQK